VNGGDRRVRASRPVLLLDLDRTLVDVEPFVDYCAALAELRLIVPDAGAGSVDRAWGSCTRAAMAILAARSSDPVWPAASAAVEAYELVGIERSRPMPGLAAFVARIDPTRTAIVTLLTDRGARRALELHGVPPPAVVVGRRAGFRPKPAPDPLLAALDGLGAEASAAVMVGDSEVDEAAARAAGIRFVGITNGRSEHGFGPASIVVRDLFEAVLELEGLGLVHAAAPHPYGRPIDGAAPHQEPSHRTARDASSSRGPVAAIPLQRLDRGTRGAAVGPVARDDRPSPGARLSTAIGLVFGLTVSGLVGFVVALAVFSLLGQLLARGEDDSPLAKSLVFTGYVVWGAIALAGVLATWHLFRRRS